MGHVRRLKVTPALSGTAADARPSGGGVNARLGTASRLSRPTPQALKAMDGEEDGQDKGSRGAGKYSRTAGL